MKFKTDLAQAAYDEIMKLGSDTLDELNDVLNHLAPGKEGNFPFNLARFSTETNARAIEVAAKIEVECLKAQFEQDERWATPQNIKPDCSHDWIQPHSNDIIKGRFFCTKCFLVKFKPAEETPDGQPGTCLHIWEGGALPNSRLVCKYCGERK